MKDKPTLTEKEFNEMVEGLPKPLFEYWKKHLNKSNDEVWVIPLATLLG